MEEVTKPPLIQYFATLLCVCVTVSVCVFARCNIHVHVCAYSENAYREVYMYMQLIAPCHTGVGEFYELSFYSRTVFPLPCIHY